MTQKTFFSRTPDNLVLSLNIYYWPLISKDSPITIPPNLTNMFVSLFRRFERYRKYQKLDTDIFLCHAVVKVPSLSLVYPCNYWFDTTRSQPKNDLFRSKATQTHSSIVLRSTNRNFSKKGRLNFEKINEFALKLNL